MGWEDPDPAEVVTLHDEGDWAELAERYEPNLLPRPLERCLEVARLGGARTAVVEARYIDIDYRSEYSSFFSKTFGNVPDSVHRVHFFAAEVTEDVLPKLSSAMREAYLGYVIVRPSPLGRVGRTLLAPPPDADGSVHSAVEDFVNFFGQQLTVSGVPFAQQDTQFGRCAHVAAWVCHYTAVLRGDTARRPMADFSLLADANVAEGRPLPSQGLTGLQLSNLMREFGLPPVVYRMGSIPASGQEPDLPDHDEGEDPGKWDTRAIAVLCRFLNSGYPVLVCTHEHAFAIVGYRRENRVDGQWIGFVRHDDQRGPYLPVEDILDDIDPATQDQHSPWQLLIAPVPDKLWLMPESAERVGRAYLMAYDQFERTGTFEELESAGQLTFRTVAMSSSSFKEVTEARGLDESSATGIRLARFSRLVWVVEAIDREARKAGAPCVLGEVVFDSTSSDSDPQALAVRVPGALVIRQSDGTVRSPLPSTTEAVLSAAQFQP
jgi:hypothetical protein